ncbi:MAG: hypothetical protein JRH15_16695 [Deltaproteobacteria bacterium]|nr:hypothetical protein [Deltaproteobacteria bacterium]
MYIKWTVEPVHAGRFLPLLQRGVRIKAKAGERVSDFLYNALALTPADVANRIQTIFLDGKPLDDLESHAVAENSVLALSAAMPGLVGAALRMGSPLASLRQVASPEKRGPVEYDQDVFVTVKLFNLLVSELGPSLLKRGIWVSESELNKLRRL